MSDLLERLARTLAGRYRIERELGRGGMATVFLGEDVKHRRSVAIKVLDPELSMLLGVQRFHQEIQFAARLQHPHILTLLDSGAGSGLLYYVMPFIEGESLRARLDRERQLPLEEAVRLATEIARALDYAHRHGIIHRDIKPENILLADGQAVVADFGIARAIRVSGGETLTRSGAALGTPPYMSPEQTVTGGEVDGRSDIYSLACVLYEMLAGQPPFTGPIESLPHQHLNVAPRPISQLRPTVPPALEAALGRALAKTPADRFSTASQFAEALKAGKAAPPPESSLGPQAPEAEAETAETRTRKRAIVIAVGAVLAVVAVAIVAQRANLLPKGLGPAPHEASRQWVWVAALEGPPDDPSLALAATDLVGSNLDQSPILATVPAEQMRIALRNAGRTDDAPVDATLARELAYRSSVPVVVEGRIARVGSGFSLVLRATESENGRVVLSTSASAQDERELMPALGRMARAIRKGLGERTPLFQRRLPVPESPTPSFAAFKLFVKGRALINQGEAWNALPLLRQAVTLDSAFATAWSGLGTAYTQMGRFDSALISHRRALRHPDRLTEARRLDVLAKVANLEGKPREAIDFYDAMLALDSSPVDVALALHNKANVVALLGNDQEALELFQRSAATWPVEPPPTTLDGITSMLLALGRVDEAKAMLPKLKGTALAGTNLEIALNERAWSRAESLAVMLRSQAGYPPMMRIMADVSRASVLAARGGLEEAARLLQQTERFAYAERDTLLAVYVFWQRTWFASLSGSPLPRSAGVDPRSSLLVAMRASFLGDSATAWGELQKWKQHVPQRFGDSVNRPVEMLVQALLDYRQGRWNRLIDNLAEVARDGKHAPQPIESFRTTYRWLVADAFEHLGQPDSSLVYLGLILEPPAHPPQVMMERGLSEPFVRRRMVALLAGSGRTAEARRQWMILAGTATRPDPSMVSLLDETRSRLQAAEAMSAVRPR